MVACTFGDKSRLKIKNGIIGKRRRDVYMFSWVPFGGHVGMSLQTLFSPLSRSPKQGLAFCWSLTMTEETGSSMMG